MYYRSPARWDYNLGTSRIFLVTAKIRDQPTTWTNDESTDTERSRRLLMGAGLEESSMETSYNEKENNRVP